MSDKAQHGGTRPGAGRKPLDPEQVTVRVTVAMTGALRAYFAWLGGGNVSEGVRRAGEFHRKLGREMREDESNAG